MSPDPPYLLKISDDSLIPYYHDNTNITVTAGEPCNIRCAAYGAIPPAVLKWRIPDDVAVVLQDQANVVRSYSYISLRTATITPSRNDQGKRLYCVASHQELQNNIQLSFRLNVHVQPSSMLLSLTEDNKEHDSESAFIHVQEGSSTSITCKSIGSFPAVELSWILLGDSSSTPANSSLSKYPNDLNESLFDTESTIAIYPQRGHHSKFIQCLVSLDKVYIDLLMAKLIVYGPPDGVEMTTPGELYIGMETNASCRAANGYPAPLIHWYIGSRNVTHDSSLKSSVNVHGRYDAVSTLTLIPKRFYHEKSLLCQAVQHTTPSMQAVQHTRPSMWSVNYIMDLNISFTSDPPSRFSIDPNQTTSSTIFVAWQPGYDGGLQQTFTLEYCPNDTQVEKDGCNVVTKITGTSYTLVGLNSFTWYRMSLWAVNIAGNSSAVETVASTTPFQPESYGITSSWDKQKHILTLSEANQSHEEICFITLRTYNGPDCASVNRSKCIEPGTEVSIDPDDDTVLVTFGRELCSKPADILTDLSVEKQPSTESNLPYMIIAIGVSAAAGFILLISLGLMYFYGVLCCVKRKKDHGKHNQPEGQMVDLGEYAEIAPVPPSHASKSTTSDYMDLKPIPRTNTDTTASYYMDLKPIPRTNTDTTSSDYMDLKHIPRTNTDTTTSYYMDLKPSSHTNNDTPTSNYMDMKPISPTDNDEYISPSATRECPEAVYVNRDMTEKCALQNDPDNQYCVSPSPTRKCSGAVNVNTDENTSKNESGDPQYINTLPTAQEANAKTTTTYMNMYPIPPMSSP